MAVSYVLMHPQRPRVRRRVNDQSNAAACRQTIVNPEDLDDLMTSSWRKTVAHHRRRRPKWHVWISRIREATNHHTLTPHLSDEIFQIPLPNTASDRVGPHALYVPTSSETLYFSWWPTRILH